MARGSTITILAAAALAATVGSVAAQPGFRAGVLDCRGAPSIGYVVGSNRRLDCVFHADNGAAYHYVGLVRRVGLDLGFTQQSALGWAVFAPAQQIGPDDLAGTYAGVTAGAAVGVGATANALVGGSGNSLTLQPLSLEGQTGLNVAVGLEGMQLEPAPPMVGARAPGRGWHRRGHHVAMHRFHHRRHYSHG
jgi:hypothetical protein